MILLSIVLWLGVLWGVAWLVGEWVENHRS